jgi:hypothetical protein
MFGLEKYKDALGKPNEGVHSARILGLAFWDIIGMIILILILSQWYDNMWIIVPIATILIHKVFGVKTAFNNAIKI